MNQLNEAREKLKTYEKLRDKLRGLDDLATGIEILIDILTNIPDQKNIAKNMAITYRSDSLFWVKGVFENRSGDEPELKKLDYSIRLMNEFVEVNKLIDTDSEFDHVKQLIEKRHTELDLELILTDEVLDNVILKLSEDEQEKFILLLEKLGSSGIRFKVEKARTRTL